MVCSEFNTPSLRTTTPPHAARARLKSDPGDLPDLILTPKLCRTDDSKVDDLGKIVRAMMVCSEFNTPSLRTTTPPHAARARSD
jgi:hypothetical protein